MIQIMEKVDTKYAIRLKRHKLNLIEGRKWG